jgi:hypothetical protein
VVKDHHCVPPEADGPVFLSGVWCHVSPATGKVRGRSPGQAVSPELSAPDGFAAYIRTGVARLRNDQKKFGRHVQVTEDFFSGPRPRDQIFTACVERPDSTIDNGVALIFSGQINM